MIGRRVLHGPSIPLVGKMPRLLASALCLHLRRPHNRGAKAPFHAARLVLRSGRLGRRHIKIRRRAETLPLSRSTNHLTMGARVSCKDRDAADLFTGINGVPSELFVFHHKYSSGSLAVATDRA
jgi:hypothetical protein